MITTDLSVQGTSPVIPYATGTWDSGGLGNPDVIWDTIGNRWLMSYSGYSTTTSKWSLGLAYNYSSYIAGPVGAWTLEPTNPVMTPTGSNYIVGNGSVIVIGSTYYSFQNEYGASPIVTLGTSTTGVAGSWSARSTVLSDYAADPMVRLMPDGTTLIMYCVNASRLPCSYTSTNNGASWVGPVSALPFFPPNGYSTYFGEPAVVSGAGSDLHAFCEGTTGAGLGRRIHRAYSPDGGLTWTWQPNTIVADPGSSWMSGGVFDSAPVFVPGSAGIPDRLFLFFAGSTNTQPTQPTDAGVGMALATHRKRYI